MSICRGCGGVLGIHCYNEFDCVQISESNYINDTQELDFLRQYCDYLESVLNENKIPFIFYVPDIPTPFKPVDFIGCETKEEHYLPF